MSSKITQGAGRKIGILAAALMVMMAMTAAPAAAAEGDLEVTVNDADGNAVEGASVTVTDSSGSEVGNGTTNSSGVVSLTGVGSAGDSVTVNVTADGYQDASQSVTLDSGATTTTTISLTESTSDSGGDSGGGGGFIDSGNSGIIILVAALVGLMLLARD